MSSLANTLMMELTKPNPLKEIDILWITACLGCDGDTIAITAATQPSLEQILLGGIPLIPLQEKVKGACEILGLDPLYVANEGKLVAIVAPDLAEALVARMRQHRYGSPACIIRAVKEAPGGIVSMRTGFGGTRIVDMLLGEELTRIC